MLHVLIKALIERLGAAPSQKLLDLVLAWQKSPKRILHTALAECLGLFAEVQRGSAASQFCTLALPALASVLPSTTDVQAAGLSLTVSGVTSSSWRTDYSVARAFEKIL